MKLNETHINGIKKHFYESVQTDLLKDYIQDKDTISYVAVDSNEIVGFVYGYILKRIDTLPMLFIYSIDVIPTHQQQGIGTLLMKEMLKLQEEKQVSKTFVITNKSNKKAMKLYTKLGGITLADDDIVIGYK